MGRLICLSFVAIAAIGCTHRIKFNTKVSPMAEIQKMDNVVEISIWDCGTFDKPGKCFAMRKLSGISDKHRISEVMTVVRELKIIPDTGNNIPGIMICFKNKNGKFLCTNKECESGKILYGQDYRDETGKLYDALKSSGLWDIETVVEGKKLKIISMEEVQKIDNVKEISIWSYREIMSSTEIEDLGKETITDDKQKIADIMSVIRDLKITPAIDTVPLSLLCFEDPNNKLFCTYFGTDPNKETYGLDFDDKSGNLYDTLKAAGLIPKWAETETIHTNTIPAGP